jgi:mannose-1-phosphate guanylyltransferase
MTKTPNFYPVILAGGRGTRFWPLSRKKRAKQLLALNHPKRSMIQETAQRLLALAPARRFWVVTNGDLRDGILAQLPKIPAAQVLAEPTGRNTAPAIGLAAFILERIDPSAVLGLFPSDQVIADEPRFQQIVSRATEIASEPGNMVTLGIQPTRPETGYGYIEAGSASDQNAKANDGVAIEVRRVRRFTEKPDLDRARQFVASGNYFWNSGMFLWSAATLANALREHLPDTALLLEKIAAAWGTPRFTAAFKRLYPRCENISVDYAIAEPRSQKGEHASKLFCIPSEFGWNDLGSWATLYEHRTAERSAKHSVMADDKDRRGPGFRAEVLAAAEANVVESAECYMLNAEGNYVHAPGKFVAVVGVKGLVVVETEDALLITTRDAAQDVGKIVKHLDERKLGKLV